MWCRVKLNDLKELVEPPLGRTLGASTSTPPKDAAMDLDKDDRLQEAANVMAQFSPGKANFSLV